MRDDLRTLVENEFPRLALAIARQLATVEVVPRSQHPDQRIRDRWHPGQVDLARPMVFMGPHEMSEGRTRYAYCPVAAPGNGGFTPGTPYEAACISFYNVRLVEIEDIEPGDVDVLNPDDPGEALTVIDYLNDGPTIYRKRMESEKEREREEEHSFGVMVGMEYRRRALARGGIEMEGVEAGGEVEEELTLRAEARTDHEWRKSDRLRDSVEDEYEVAPFHHWTLTTRKNVKNIRQDVLVTGRLQCAVRIDSRDRNSTDFDSLDDLIDTFRGLNPKYGPYSRWFGRMRHALPDAVFDAWPMPKLRLNLPIEGKRTRYEKAVSRQMPLPGHEEDAAAATGVSMPDLELPPEWGEDEEE